MVKYAYQFSPLQNTLKAEIYQELCYKFVTLWKTALTEHRILVYYYIYVIYEPKRKGICSMPPQIPYTIIYSATGGSFTENMGADCGDNGTGAYPTV